MKWLGTLKYRKIRPLGSGRGRVGLQSSTGPPPRLQDRFAVSIDANLRLFEQMFGQDVDFVLRRFQVAIGGRWVRCGLLYFVETSSKSDLNEVLRALMVEQAAPPAADVVETVVARCLPYADVTVKDTPQAAVEWLLAGNSLLLLDGCVQAVGLNTQAYKERAISEPETEQVIQGSREGFIESMGTNVSLLRKRLRSKDLRIRLVQLGRRTTTNVVYCYLESLANPQLVQEVERRLRLVDTDALFGSGYLEQFIEDNHYSPFPQIQNTERPDKAVAAMLEGRVVIVVDGSPFALIVPAVFSQFYQAAEDYDTRFLMASMTRGIRLLALLFSLVFPSLYVSLISFNPEMIPTKFEVAVASGRAGVPFPAIAEIFGLELVMEVLREATVRLPQQIGGALSIVGVLVVGEAAVRAGFVSPIAVVIVAMTTIGSFATPAYNAAIALRMLRFPLMVLAGIFGLYGVMVGLILICNHLNGLESFGVPYLSPIVPADAQGLKDTVVRMPVWSLQRRPKGLQPQDVDRVATDSDKLSRQKTSPLAPQHSQAQASWQAAQNAAEAGDKAGQDGQGGAGDLRPTGVGVTGGESAPQPDRAAEPAAPEAPSKRRQPRQRTRKRRNQEAGEDT